MRRSARDSRLEIGSGRFALHSSQTPIFDLPILTLGNRDKSNARIARLVRVRMNVKRITRLLRLLQNLQSGNGFNAAGIATQLSVSCRTFYRDVEALRAAGVPVYYDAQLDRYSVPSSYYLPPTNFTPREAVSLVALATELGKHDRLPFYDSARAAALKLESSYPQELREAVRSLCQSIRIQPLPVSRLDSKQAMYERLVEARAAGQVVRVEYQYHPARASTTTKFRTYHLVFCRHSWYAIGRSSAHRRICALDLSRVTAIEPTGETFQVPQRFNIDRHLGNAWQLTPEHGPDHDVVIRFAPEVALSIADITWHKTQRLEFEADGTVIFRANVSGLTEIVSWILAYGDQAEVLRPERLRELVVQHARNMLRRYEDRNARMAGEQSSPTALTNGSGTAMAPIVDASP